ncbi:MAG: hypothetical protein IT374_19215 [Polyangiaceae bacterium]|nr:hypothetical protein [Polyangiaceae bacterium]
MSARGRQIAVAVAVAAAWAGAAWAARARGFHELSDDDHARVVIAEAFARAPRLDPSGTSWLPFPFWLNGAAMMLLGRSLEVARGVAVASAAASGALLFFTATRLRLGAWSAFFAATLPLSIPLVPALGAATVPELLAAALGCFALASSAAGAHLAAASAVTLACWSRYELWPLSPVVAAHAALHAWAEPEGRGRAGAGAVTALLGPAAWLAHNAVAHGSATWFSSRVTEFRAASGVASDALAFPRAALLGAPAHVLAATVGVAALGREGVRRARLPLAGAAAVLAGLAIAAARGTTPTHHPERAVLIVWLLACPVFALTLPEVFATRLRVRPALSLLLVVGAAVAAGWVKGKPQTTQADRRAWEATGRLLRDALRPGERVLVVPDSYSYLAGVAALGRPEDVETITLRAFDPRGAHDVDPTTSVDALCQAAARGGAGVALLTHAQAGRLPALPPGGHALPAGLLVPCRE